MSSVDSRCRPRRIVVYCACMAPLHIHIFISNYSYRVGVRGVLRLGLEFRVRVKFCVGVRGVIRVRVFKT